MQSKESIERMYNQCCYDAIRYFKEKRYREAALQLGSAIAFCNVLEIEKLPEEALQVLYGLDSVIKNGKRS